MDVVAPFVGAKAHAGPSCARSSCPARRRSPAAGATLEVRPLPKVDDAGVDGVFQDGDGRRNLRPGVRRRGVEMGVRRGSEKRRATRSRRMRRSTDLSLHTLHVVHINHEGWLVCHGQNGVTNTQQSGKMQ